jgi:hypothetical protein
VVCGLDGMLTDLSVASIPRVSVATSDELVQVSESKTVAINGIGCE